MNKTELIEEPALSAGSSKDEAQRRAEALAGGSARGWVSRGRDATLVALSEGAPPTPASDGQRIGAH